MRHKILLGTLAAGLLSGVAISIPSCADREVQDDQRIRTCQAFCSNEDRCYPGVVEGDYNNSRDYDGCMSTCLNIEYWDACEEEIVDHFGGCFANLTCEEYELEKSPVDSEERPCFETYRPYAICKVDYNTE